MGHVESNKGFNAQALDYEDLFVDFSSSPPSTLMQSIAFLQSFSS